MFLLGFCYPVEWDTRELSSRLERLKALGYDGVEFWEKDIKELGVSRLAQTLAEVGIRCAQICPYFDFVHSQKAWDNTMRIAEEYITAAIQLGKPLVRVFTGGNVGPTNATPAQWDAAISGLQRICDMAVPEGIRLALECHSGSLMEDSPSTLRLLQGVCRPNLGVNLQLPLKGGQEPVDISIEQLGPYTWHTHAHNYTALVGGEFRLLGQGVLDYHSILSRLLGCGFRGYVSIEHPSHEGTRDPWEIARLEADYLAALRSQLNTELRPAAGFFPEDLNEFTPGADIA